MQKLWCSLQVLIQNIIKWVHIRIDFKGPFPWILFPSLGTYSGKTLQMISFPTGKIFCDNKKQMLLAKSLWICDFHSLAVLDFFSNDWWNHSTDTFYLYAVAPFGFASAFAYQELLCLSFDFSLVPHFLQIYSGFLFSLFSVHINLLWDFP